LNLNGKSQLFNTFESGNILAGAATEGGTLISEAPAKVTIQGGGAFSGHIDGAITLDKVGNNTLLLTNSNSTTGNVAIRQGTITLRDNGTLSNVGSVDINYGRLEIENGYLSRSITG
jgi:autotransporter-associated beta strand protein